MFPLKDSDGVVPRIEMLPRAPLGLSLVQEWPCRRRHERSGSTHGISNGPLECSFDELSIHINTYNKNVNPIPYNR